jgi:hypothetical protein
MKLAWPSVRRVGHDKSSFSAKTKLTSIRHNAQATFADAVKVAGLKSLPPEIHHN